MPLTVAARLVATATQSSLVLGRSRRRRTAGRTSRRHGYAVVVGSACLEHVGSKAVVAIVAITGARLVAEVVLIARIVFDGAFVPHRNQAWDCSEDHAADDIGRRRAAVDVVVGVALQQALAARDIRIGRDGPDLADRDGQGSVAQREHGLARRTRDLVADLVGAARRTEVSCDRNCPGNLSRIGVVNRQSVYGYGLRQAGFPYVA